MDVRAVLSLALLTGVLAWGAVFTTAQPTLSFIKDDQGPGGTFVILETDSGLDWQDLSVSGTGCDVPTGAVDRGDRIACGPGSFEVRYAPTRALLYRTTLAD